MGKKKSGTISKVITDHFEKLSDKDEVFLRNNAKQIIIDFKTHEGKYTRFTSDLIKRLRDIAERLILGGKELGLTQRDTAAVVWKWMEDNNIDYPKRPFYRYFLPEQKREWQSQELQENTEDHKHEFVPIGHLDGLGDIEKCLGKFEHQCSVLRIDGRIHQALQEEPPEPELKTTKQKSELPEKYWPIIKSFQDAADVLYDYAGVLKNDITKLTDEEFKIVKSENHIMKKCTEFVKMAINKKEIIDPFTQHLLVLAYANAGQKRAGGLFIKYRMDIAERKHAESIKDFTDEVELSRLLSTKQTGKAMRGRVRKLHQRYEPKNEKNAQDMGLSGQQCTKCGKFRVDFENIPNPYWQEGMPAHEKSNKKLICLGCGEEQITKLFPLPKCKPVVYVDLAQN